ncbi:MAG: tetratricopeptide repeat protein, partial [Pelovirga sp.]
MLTNKDKLLESAQKNLKKKQISKAIKDYARVVEIDPADVRVRQKLAELYVRSSKTAEAYEQYELIAKYFASNGFNLKAIAIYKQMQRLDPTQVAIYNRLADLNAKQGLLGNAMSKYRSLVDHYERNGMIADMIKTLEKMRDLDPNNLNVRVKLAEILATSQRKDEGLRELELVIEILEDKGDFEKCLKLYNMFLPHYPGNRHLQMGLARIFYAKKDYAKGVALLGKLYKEKPQDPDLLRLLGRGHAGSGDHARAAEIFRQLLVMDPSDLDVRAGLIQSEIDSEQADAALAELEEWKDSFLKSDRLERLKGFYEQLNELLPGNAAVIHTLDSIYELTGEGSKRLDILSEKESADAAAGRGEMLSDSLLGSVDLDIAADGELDIPLSEAGLDFDVLEDDGLDLLAGQADQLSADESEYGPEIELDFSDLEEIPAVSARTQPDALDDLDGDFIFAEEEQPAVASASGGTNLQADLEEAEFYLQQGLYDDAERLCREVLHYAPDAQECHRKLKEIAELRLAQKEHREQQPAASSAEALTEFAFEDFDFDARLEQLQTQTLAQKKIFRTDVDEQIAADDMESHYNLGIAYGEMGLLDDAISEFEKAQRDPS